MDIETMHLAVNLGLQRIASHVFDDFQPEEIDFYLNDAILKFVESNKDRILLTPETPEAIKSSEDIRTLIHTTGFTDFDLTQPLANVSQVPPKAEAINLSVVSPSFGWYLSSRTQFDDLNTGGWKNNRLVSINQWYKYSELTTNTPYFRELPVMIEGNLLKVIKSTEDGEIIRQRLTYVTYPATVKNDYANAGAGSVDCNLPLHTHQKIVDLTVQLMHEDLRAGGE